MFTDLYNPYKVDYLDGFIYWLSLIIVLVITIISLVKFFKLCKNVAYIADVMKAQQNNLTTAQSGDNPTEQSAQPAKNDDSINWNAFIIATICVIFFIAVFYFSISGKL